jgi:hypothetical protein
VEPLRALRKSPTIPLITAMLMTFLAVTAHQVSAASTKATQTPPQRASLAHLMSHLGSHHSQTAPTPRHLSPLCRGGQALHAGASGALLEQAQDIVSDSSEALLEQLSEVVHSGSSVMPRGLLTSAVGAAAAALGSGSCSFPKSYAKATQTPPL